MKDRSPWLSLHISLPKHRKTDKLAVALGVDRVTASGHIIWLWLWALEQAQDGDLSGFSDEAIAEAAGWKKKPNRFIDALLASGFVDKDMTIHEHQEYVGPLMKKRRKDRERIAEKRATEERQSQESRSDVARHSQQSTVNSTLTTTTTARERYFRAFGHEGTQDQISTLESYIETHPPACVEWVFSEVAGSARPGFGLARFLFNECAAGIGTKAHGPRERQRATPQRTGQGHPAPANGRPVRRTSDFE